MFVIPKMLVVPKMLVIPAKAGIQFLALALSRAEFHATGKSRGAGFRLSPE